MTEPQPTPAPMTLAAARTAIEDILRAIPDNELPLFDRITHDDDSGMPTAWFGGHGFRLGSARHFSDRTSEGRRAPSNYRQQSLDEAIAGEMLYRADQLLLDNGDDPTAVTFKTKR